MHGPIRRSAASELMRGPMIDACLSYKSGSVLTTLLCHSHNKHFTPLQTLCTTDPILTAVKDSEAQKKRKHREACAEHQLQFVPMSVDHWGIWGKESEAAFEHVARAYAAAVGKSRCKVRSTF